jgi:hypothetical protein
MSEALPAELGSLASALAAALLPDGDTRRRGEETLRVAAAEPGFCAKLLALTDVRSQLPDGVRLLAATQLKNEAVRHWRRGAQQAEQERDMLRAALVARLAQPEASERVGVQIALAVARIMRSEANTGEATVLEAFAQTLACVSITGHALLALLHTAKELATMRLPAQRRLAGRVGHVMVGLVGPRWEAAMRAVLEAEAITATPSVLHAAVLHTKLLRRLLALAALGAAPPLPNAGATPPASMWPLDRASMLVIEAAAAVQRAGGRLPAVSAPATSKLGSALGKLLVEVYKAAVALPGPGGAADAGHEVLNAAAAMLLVEADGRRALRLRMVPGADASARAATVGGSASAHDDARGATAMAATLHELEFHETHGSLLPARLANLIAQHGAADAGWLAACHASGRLAPLLRTLVTLIGRPVEQMRRWASDPESFACEVLLPLDNDDDEDEDEDGEEGGGGGGGGGEEEADEIAWLESIGAGKPGVNDEEDLEEEPGGPGAAGADEDDGALDDDDDGAAGGGGGADQGWSSGAASDVLQQQSEAALLALLCAAPDETGPALFALMPADACAPFESLDAQVDREACYTALGIGAFALQDTSLTYGHVFAAAAREVEAAAAALATNPSFVIGAALQARLCWLLSCWWAFGYSGDEAEDTRLCHVSYGLLASLTHAGLDLAVRLQAVHVLRTLVRSAGDEDLATFVPHAPLALAGLAGILTACTADDALLCVLRATRTFFRRVPELVQSAPMREAMAPALDALWRAAEREQRVMVQHALRKVLPR